MLDRDGPVTASERRECGEWSSPTLVDPNLSLASVSCPSASFCAAVDGLGNALTFDGTSWSAPKPVPGAGGLSAVSCTSSTFCLAIGHNVAAYTFNGNTWTQTSAFDTAGTYSWPSVSCTSTTFCVAVGNTLAAPDLSTAQVLEASKVFNGSTWSAATTISWGWVNGWSDGAVLSVSCVSTAFCVAAELQPSSGEGSEVAFNGTSWSPIGQYDYYSPVMAVSCVSTTSCMAVDGIGNAISLTELTKIDGNQSLTAVSCASDVFCMATDAAGEVLQYS